ncbi:uncharacterized protein C8Q71DRAFT_727323 [Rhodofomes roseus]|uniref:Uncharacterized protein n=1 Tax=Rhodofomes roseus TaxID=34475 RepID=A0ABQ8K1K5_9APHY|nr:uncharacterized protein C8Q71DRAFT_727323 [Rhodofomes roseus]KAH9830559.1 hypothetical protein C8Q71DRAFT_727323 [Rhodofomes roseus]
MDLTQANGSSGGGGGQGQSSRANAEYNPFGDKSWIYEHDVPPEVLAQISPSPPPLSQPDPGPHESPLFSQFPTGQQTALTWQDHYPRAAWWLNAGPPPPDIAQLREERAGVEREPSPVGPHRPPAQAVRVSVPLDTMTSSPPYLRDLVTIDSDVSWTDFIDRIRARMGLVDEEVDLAYKMDGAKNSDDFKVLANLFNMHEAFQEYIGTNLRARKKRDLVIYNLTAERDDRAQPKDKGKRGQKKGSKKGKKAKKDKKGKKRPREESSDSDSSSDEPSDASRHLAAMSDLKEHLRCHDAHCINSDKPNRWCYIDRRTAGHVDVDIKQITWWAHEIAHGNATLNTPPEGQTYDPVNSKRRAVERARKERRVVAAESSTERMSVPAINPASDTNNDSVVFPTTAALLLELNQTRPAHNYPQYEPRLAELGFCYTVDFENFDLSLFTDHAGMPPGAVRPMLECAHVLTRRARKGKGRAKEKENDVDM